jgi:hypothetical protein
VTGNITPVIGKGWRAAAEITSDVKNTHPSLLISHNTTDGSVNSPVANVSVTNDKLIYLTVTRTY